MEKKLVIILLLFHNLLLYSQQWPIKNETPKVAGSYGYHEGFGVPVVGGGYHAAIDIPATSATAEVVASVNSEVIEIDAKTQRIQLQEIGSNNKFTYGHCKPLSTVTIGSIISEGSKFATIVPKGIAKTSFDHVHFIYQKGVVSNPLQYFGNLDPGGTAPILGPLFIKSGADYKTSGSLFGEVDIIREITDPMNYQLTNPCIPSGVLLTKLNAKIRRFITNKM